MLRPSTEPQTYLQGADVGQSFGQLDDVIVAQVQGAQAAQTAHAGRQLSQTVTCAQVQGRDMTQTFIDSSFSFFP